MVDKGRSDFNVVFTMIICGASICVLQGVRLIIFTTLVQVVVKDLWLMLLQIATILRRISSFVRAGMAKNKKKSPLHQRENHLMQPPELASCQKIIDSV